MLIAVSQYIDALLLLCTAFSVRNVSSYTPPSPTRLLLRLQATPLPSGLSPFEKGASKSLNLQGTFRKLAASAIDKAVKNGERLVEVDFPPFIGGKSQFDDYDNVSELDTNRDWCAQLVPMLSNQAASKCTWLVLPDDKECELAAIEWTGQLYRSETKRFTSIRAACEATSGSLVKKAWGSNLAETFNKLQGGDGVLADSTKLDTLTLIDGRFQLICQPGNGGPVEDWINVEQLAQGECITCVVNGALDKVRDGYYPAIFFPALAKTTPFYKTFEPVFIAKPLNDKGFAGWLFRVYPEPWQVILQTARPDKNNDLKVINTVVLETTERPSYTEAVNALITEGLRQT